MKFKARVIRGELRFSTERAKNRFFKDCEGLHVILQTDNAVSGEVRRFFEGAIIPYIFYQHKPGTWNDFGECREAVKQWFRPVKMHDLHGKLVTIGESTSGKSWEWFYQFLEDITTWMRTNGYEVPDAENYKMWMITTPPSEEIYPPLQRLIDSYKATIEEEYPWRKQ